LAGPLTLLRGRRDTQGGAGLRATLGRLRTWPRRAVGSGMDLRSGPGANGRFAAWWAAPLIAVMAAAAVLMGLATYHLTDRAITASQLAAKRLGDPLLRPAPGTAGGFPKRIGTITDPAVLAIVREFRQRFRATGGAMVASARLTADPASGRSSAAGRDVTAFWTSGLYGQPGHLDPRTLRPSWISYYGLDTNGVFGRPAASIMRLMRGLIGAVGPGNRWPVAAGQRGGSANCTMAWLGHTCVSVCGWATDHTIGALASPASETAVRELTTLMLKMHNDLQRR
jgi:hypothetical protein